MLVILVVFHFQLLNNIYKQNKTSYTIIIINKMIVVNTCISQERLGLSYECFHCS